MGLTETHAGKDDILGIPGFTTFTACRNKHKNARKHSGGVAILVRNCFVPGIEIKRSSSDLIWAKFEKSFFGLHDDLYVGVVYISPQNSICTRDLSEKVWEELESDVGKYSRLGKVMVLGDFNSRTGALQTDHIVHDDSQYTPTDGNYLSDEKLLHRNSLDKNVNEFGRRLLDLCKTSRLRIANGRVLGDTCGNLTCFQWNGCSVVDYCLAEEDLLGAVEYFKVHEFKGLFSNHCKISVKLPSCIRLTSVRQEMFDLPRRVKWCDKVKTFFESNFTNGRGQNENKDNRE